MTVAIVVLLAIAVFLQLVITGTLGSIQTMWREYIAYQKGLFGGNFNDPTWKKEK